MTELERGLQRAIAEDPDDDGVRLVYADFLEERGDPRGEFIRLQVARHRKGDATPSPREAALLERHFDDWTREARPFDASKVSLHFERGFLALAIFDNATDEDLDVLRRLSGLQALILRSSQVSPAGLRLVASLALLREFSFDREAEIGAEGLAILEALPCWTLVRWARVIQTEPRGPRFRSGASPSSIACRRPTSGGQPGDSWAT